MAGAASDFGQPNTSTSTSNFKKPQRPVRMLRVHGDENIPPAIDVNKTLHQRNKSTPALSAMLNAGGLKAAAKRTAFGDVSNTVKNVQPTKDDSFLSGKTGVQKAEKAMIIQQDIKPSALLRPAQRPLSISGLKGLLSTTTTTTHLLPTIKKPLGEIQSANTGKILTTRNATIAKDFPSAIIEQLPLVSQKELQTIVPIAPVHQNLQPRHHKSQPYIRADQPILRRTKSKYAANFAGTQEDGDELAGLTVLSDESAAVRSDGIYVDGDSEKHSYRYTDEVVNVEEAKRIDLKSGEFSKEEHHRLVMEETMEEQDRLIIEEAIAENIMVKGQPSLSEPEEYWEEEEYEENYDEEGYTTARSYRSRGDNTTGGATTVLFPKMNVKVRKELAAAKQLVENSRTLEEIEDESWDTSMVAEYGDEIFQYMRELEIKMLPNAHYMDNQAEIQWSMRSVLMDWLVQVHHRFTLLPETLFLCVNYIDRFLSCKIVSLGKLQLVGATAIFVAAKYEEINCPSVQEIVYMVDGGYTVDEILKAERFMLSMLQFELGWPGPMSFLRRISKADDYDLETRTLAKYFLEITVMDERFVGSPPSYVAAGAHCLARLMLKKGEWSTAHVYYSNYTYTQLFQLVSMMVECCEFPQKHHSAVYEKYTDKRYKRASLFVETEMAKGFRLPELSVDRSAGNSVGALDLSQAWRRK
ncbi:MAG: hypothetical protein M1827_001526 [Pycnora praestabilis]|nr:MAG: hypothetical protein M1827_001526 [Pycnora praestabilis]